MVLDPLKDKEWNASLVTDNFDTLIALAKDRKYDGSYIFVDEGAETIGRYDSEKQWIFTRGRHHGHQTFLIAQDLTQVAPVVRRQCSRAYVFASNKSTWNTLANDFGMEAIEDGVQLNMREFITLQRFTENGERYKPTKHKIEIPDTGERATMEQITINNLQEVTINGPDTSSRDSESDSEYVTDPEPDYGRTV